MQVKVGNRVYTMGKKEFDGLLKIAEEQVPFGVYAVEKKGYAELRCDRCNSKTQLKKTIRAYRENGFKVHANGR